MAGHPQPGVLAHERLEQRVGGEERVDRDRVRVEVEEPAAPLDRGGQVAQVVEAEVARDVIGLRA